MSKIEVDTIAPQSGTNINLGESGDTVTVPAGVTLDTTNSTVTLPDGSVTNAKLANSSITINGSSVSLGGSTTIETGTSWQSTIVTGSTLSAVAGNGYWIDTTSNACTVTLPASASVGDQLIFVDYKRTWGTNKITLNTNGLNFQGNPTTASGGYPEYNTDGQSVSIIYSGATQGWIPTVDDDVSYETPQTYSVDFLVIGGGGGANTTSNNYGAGGGAGGYRSSYNSETSGGGGSAETALVLQLGSTYTITIGAGGSGGGGTGATSGTDSSIIGTGVSLTSLGGGASAVSSSVIPDPRNGVTGGSGGGGTGGGSGASGTANQGYAGGNSPSDQSGGGGGGAGANGASGSSGSGGSGGNGVASTITGSSVTRAGGGGASGNSSGGSAGSGGGGVGSTTIQTTSQNGTANTGGGAGSANGYTGNGSGGSGVVILRMATANYSGTTSGSPTVTTDGSDTILVFNASGSYTG